MLMALLPFTAWAADVTIASGGTKTVTYDGAIPSVTVGTNPTNAADWTPSLTKDAGTYTYGTGDDQTTLVIAPKELVYYLTGSTYNVGDVIDVKNHYALASGYEFAVGEKLADYAKFEFYLTGDDKIEMDATGHLNKKGTYPVAALQVIWNENAKHNYDFRFTSSAQIVVAAVNISNFIAVLPAYDFTYDGNAKTFATSPKLYRTQADADAKANALVEGTDYTTRYDKNTNAGVNTAEFIFTATSTGNYDGQNVATFTIKKANIVASDITKFPAAVAGLSYNATEKTLIEAGTIDATKGHFEYQLGDAAYSTNLPKATDANNYTVKYKIVGSDNYNNYQVEATPATATTAATYTTEWTIADVKIAKAMLVVQPKQALNVLYTGAEPDLTNVELTYTKFFGDDSKALFNGHTPTVKVADAIVTKNYAMGKYDEGLEINMTGVAELENYQVYPVNGALNITAKNVKVQLNKTWQESANFGTNEAKATEWPLLASEQSKLTVYVQNGYDADGNATYGADPIANATTVLKTTTPATNNPSKFDGLKITRSDNSTAVGKYPVTIAGAQPKDNNYVIVEQTVEAATATTPAPTFEIKAAAITVTAANKAMVYGSENEPKLTFTTAATLTDAQKKTIQDAMQREDGDDVGVYEINFKKGVAAGKDGPDIEGLSITYQVGAFAITPAPLTITAKKQTLYTGNDDKKLNQSEYTVEGLVDSDEAPEVELSFAPNVSVYSFTSFDGNETDWATGKVKVVSVDATNNETTVEVIENELLPGINNDFNFVGQQYVIKAVELGDANSYKLYQGDVATSIWVKDIALIPAESGVTLDADKKLTLAGNDPTLTIKGGIVVTVKNAAKFEQNYELQKVNGDLTVVNVNTTILLSRVNDNTDAISAAAATGNLVNVKFEDAANDNDDIWIRKEKWYTMVLPFDTKVEEISDLFGYAVVDTLNEANNTKNIQFRLHMQDLPANKPFIFKVNKDVKLSTITFPSKKIKYAADLTADGVCAKDAFGNKYIGTYGGKTGFTKNEWRMTTDDTKNTDGSWKYDKWYYGGPTSASKKIAPLSAYVLSVNEGGDATFNAPVFEIEDIGGVITSIEGVSIDAAPARSAQGWYTISGMKLEGAPTQSGVYVKDGRKVVIK